MPGTRSITRSRSGRSKAAVVHAKMLCIPDNLFADGDWAILEWSDPLGLRGCGFFHIAQDRIAFQRGYWDKLSFLRLHGLKLPTP